MNKQLFETTVLKGIKLKNRFFRASVWENLATVEGYPTKEIMDIYECLAKGGVGGIFTGYTYITKEEQPNSRMLGIYDDIFIEKYRPLTEMVHSYDVKIFAQLVYGGAQTSMEPHSKRILAPSAVKYERSGITPIEMEKADFDYIIEAFAQAALRAKKSGFDGVELHCAHGYMLSQFLCPYFNRRKDHYGGSIENRVRIIEEIISAMRTLVGVNYPILMKINCEDFHVLGLSQTDALEACRILSKSGIDGIEVSGGNSALPQVVENNLEAERAKIAKHSQSYFKEQAEQIANAVDIPVILTGGNKDYSIMDEILKATKIEYFGLARALICQENLINMWQQDPTVKARCVSCGKCSKAACILNNRND